MSLRQIIEIAEKMEKQQTQSLVSRSYLFDTKCKISRIQERLTENSPNWIRHDLEKIKEFIDEVLKP